MSPRGRINHEVTVWRNQAKAPATAPTPKPPAPDTSDGIDLFVLVLFVWFVCLIAGYVIGRH
jgi:hypothetical protein